MQKGQETIQPTLESLVEQAKSGNKEALDQLVRKIQDRIYGLALRMLSFPSDAEDATQEILIKIITHLNAFRGNSSFTTWIYRIASNHLLTTRKSKTERWSLTFETQAQGIDEGLSMEGGETFDEGEKVLIAQEVKLACMQGMLLCLNRKSRLAFILGEIIGVTGAEGAEILDLSPEAFRKRLSRGRTEIREFMTKKCGLFNPDNPCICNKMIPYVVKVRFIDPENLIFANHPCHARRNPVAESKLQELDELGRIAALFRGHPEYAAPKAFVGYVKELVDSGRFELLNDR